MDPKPVPPPVNEVVYFSGSPAGIEPIIQTVKATAIFIAVVVIFSFNIFEKVREIVGPYALLVVLVWIAYLVYVWCGWKTMKYTLTNRKITFEKGHFAKTIKSIELWRVREMIYQCGMLESFFGLGRIHLVSSDLTGPFTQVGPISQAKKVFQSLDEAREEAIKQRGVMAVES